MSEPVALLDALIYTQPEVSRPLSGGRHLDDVAVGGAIKEIPSHSRGFSSEVLFLSKLREGKTMARDLFSI